MKIFKSYFAHFFVFMVLLMPFFVHADSNLVFCNTGTPDPTSGAFQNPCGWTQLIMLAQKIINFAILLSLPIATVVIATAGFYIMSAGGDVSKVKKAKEMITKVAIGMAWVLAAWLVVNTIFKALVKDGYSPL